MPRYVHGRRKAKAVVVLAAVTALSWAGWMGWDVSYDVDATGHASGPYQPWQVVGCVLCLLVVACSAGRWLPAAEIALTMTLAFTLAFSISALLLADHEPLVVLGIMPVFFAMYAGSAFVAAVAGVLWNEHLGWPSDPEVSPEQSTGHRAGPGACHRRRTRMTRSPRRRPSTSPGGEQRCGTRSAGPPSAGMLGDELGLGSGGVAA